jgi:hypothetical protein
MIPLGVPAEEIMNRQSHQDGCGRALREIIDKCDTSGPEHKQALIVHKKWEVPTLATAYARTR